MTDENTTTEVGRLEPDPFDLPRSVRERLACSCQGACVNETSNIRYLWIHAGGELLGVSTGTPPPSPLSLESWLNVVDEAASLGIDWLVVTLETETAKFPILWDIFSWAQKTHDMNIALHLNHFPLLEKDMDALMALKRGKTHLFAPEAQISQYAHLSEKGVTVCTSNPSIGGAEPCNMPGSMLFVTAAGKLYTCGMVKGDEDFRLGDINTGFFGQILHDKQKPHTVAKSAMKREGGCAGCPPLVLQDRD